MKARRASRVLDKITARGDPVNGITMPNGSIFKLARRYIPIDILDNIADNKIVGTAEALKKEATNNADVILLTADVNMRIAARERGINADDYINRTEYISTGIDSLNTEIRNVLLLIIILIICIAFIK